MMLTITNKHNKKTILEAFVDEESKEILLIDLDMPDTYSLTNAAADDYLHTIYDVLFIHKKIKSAYTEYRFLLQGTDGIVSEWINGTFKFVRYT